MKLPRPIIAPTRSTGATHAGAGFLQAVLARPLISALLLLMMTTIAVGGTSTYFPISNGLVAMLACAVLFLTFWQWRGDLPPRDVAIGLALSFGTPLIQLVPLPPGLWSQLPGHDIHSQIAQFFDPGIWRPISLDPSATWRSVLSLLVPVAAFLALLRMRARDIVICGWAIVSVATISMALGLVQLAAGGPFLFDSLHNNFPVGFFANRNHQAALEYVGVVFAVALALRARAVGSGSWVPALVLVILLVAGLLVTKSRSGVALLAFCLFAIVLLFQRTHRRVLLIGLAIVAVFGALVSRSDTGQRMAARYAAALTDERAQIWPQTVFGTEVYAPYGSGMGTFDAAFQAIEPLATLRQQYVNHAHNDFIEIAFEGGVMGVVLMVFSVGRFCLARFCRIAVGSA